jgi:hypothetical protein
MPKTVIITLTPAQVDLDSNGTLSREEFNLFNWRTSGEEVQVRGVNVIFHMLAKNLVYFFRRKKLVF